MPILGGRINRVEAKRKEENALEGMDINFTIDSVTADKKVLTIAYTTKTDYRPSVAEITVQGEIFWEEDEKKAKEIAEDFKKTRRVGDNNTMEEILTALNYSMQAVGTLAAFALGISAPLNVPRTRISNAPPAAQAQQAAAQKGKAS